MTTPRFLQQKQEKDKSNTESKAPVKRPNFGGTLTLSGIKKKKK